MLDLLPHELLEEVIDILHVEVSSYEFRRYALVSQQFRTMCQRRIFASIDISSGLDPMYSRIHQILRFRNVLSQNPTLGSYVRELRLVYLLTLDTQRRAMKRSTIEPRAINIWEEEYDMLRLLDNVQKLTIGFKHPGEGKHASWSAAALSGLCRELELFAKRNAIETLVIFGIKNVSPSFLQQFRHLRDFTASCSSTAPSLLADGKELAASSLPQPRPCLDRLRLGECDVATFAHSLFLHPKSLFDISQISEVCLDDLQAMHCLLPSFNRLEILNVELRCECSFPVTPRRCSG
jgi:hypothetical protein